MAACSTGIASCGDAALSQWDEVGFLSRGSPRRPGCERIFDIVMNLASCGLVAGAESRFLPVWNAVGAPTGSAHRAVAVRRIARSVRANTRRNAS